MSATSKAQRLGLIELIALCILLCLCKSSSLIHARISSERV